MPSDDASARESGRELAKGDPVSPVLPANGHEELLLELKSQIRKAQIRAALEVTRELNQLYWQLGKTIVDRQETQGWGTKVVERLGSDLRAEFPDMKGLSARNLNYMRAFAAAYTEFPIVQQLVAQVPWGHNLSIIHKLRCFVVIDLKTRPFRPEYGGKMNFHLSAVDDLLRHPDDQPTIGLMLCKEHRRRLTVEYALRDLNKPIGVAQWRNQLVSSLPRELEGSLPTIEEIEAELADELEDEAEGDGDGEGD